MNKPKKKELSKPQITLIEMTQKKSCACDYGYNKACDVWEKYYNWKMERAWRKYLYNIAITDKELFRCKEKIKKLEEVKR